MAAPSQQQPPGEDREQQKQLRGNLRGMLSRTRQDKHNLVSLDDNKIIETLEQSNVLLPQITRPRDQAVDTEVFKILTESALEYVKNLNQDGRNYSAGDFIRRLKVQHVDDMDAQAAGQEDPEAFNWAGLGQMPCVAHLFTTPPSVHHMLGPLDAQPRVRRQIQRQAKRRAPVGEAVRPDEVENLEDQEKQETDRNMEEMWRVLKDIGGRVSLLDLVMNHASFAQTTENLFTLSFLVKDDRVSLEPDEVKGVMVQKRELSKQDPKDKGHELDRMQFIIALNIAQWEEWKLCTDPNRPPMMKHRQGVQWQRQQQQQQQVQQQQQQAGAAEEGEEEEVEEEERRPQPKRQRQGSGKTPQSPRQEEAGDQEQSEEEEENENAQPKQNGRGNQQKQQAKAPPPKRKARQATPQQRQQQEELQQEQQQEKQEQVQLRKARKERKPAPEQQEQQEQEQQAPRQAPQQQQQQQQPEQQTKARPAPPPKPRPAPPPPPQQQQASDSVIVISDSEVVVADSEVIVIDDSEDDEQQQPRRPTQAPAAAAAVKLEPLATQQTQGASQPSQRRGPMRGKRVSGQL